MAWVLILEDDTQVRVLAEDILKEAGHCVGPAGLPHRIDLYVLKSITSR